MAFNIVAVSCWNHLLASDVMAKRLYIASLSDWPGDGCGGDCRLCQCHLPQLMAVAAVQAAQVMDALCRHLRTVCKHRETGTSPTADWCDCNVDLIWTEGILAPIFHLVCSNMSKRWTRPLTLQILTNACSGIPQITVGQGGEGRGGTAPRAFGNWEL